MSGTKIESRIDPKSAEFEKNTRLMIERVAEIKTDEETISQGGGAKAIEAQHKKGRLTARERIAKLIDSKTRFSSWARSLPTACTRNGAARRPPEPSRVWRALADGR